MDEKIIDEIKKLLRGEVDSVLMDFNQRLTKLEEKVEYELWKFEDQCT